MIMQLQPAEFENGDACVSHPAEAAADEGAGAPGPGEKEGAAGTETHRTGYEGAATQYSRRRASASLAGKRTFHPTMLSPQLLLH